VFNVALWGQLVQWSNEPPLLTRFHFGKYRGSRFDLIAANDPDYLRWIIERSDLQDAVRHSAAYWLEHPAPAAP
jgi:exodeoxyribonuclease X